MGFNTNGLTPPDFAATLPDPLARTKSNREASCGSLDATSRHPQAALFGCVKVNCRQRGADRTIHVSRKIAQLKRALVTVDIIVKGYGHSGAERD